MKQGITLVGAVPVRKWPSEGAEMITHILFGETFDVLKIEDNWTEIQLHFDGEQGWIDTKTFYEISEKLSLRYQKESGKVLANVCRVKEHAENDYPTTLFPGSNIYDISNADKHFSIIGRIFQFVDKPMFCKDISDIRKAITENAMTYMNSPYLWGGRAFYAIDCSGLTQVVYKTFGIRITRNSYQQIEMGREVSFNDALPGDLAFFGDAEGKIKHVGIILEGGKIIHASGLVRIDKFDENGIYHEGKQRYTHKLNMIKTYL